MRARIRAKEGVGARVRVGVRVRVRAGEKGSQGQGFRVRVRVGEEGRHETRVRVRAGEEGCHREHAREFRVVDQAVAVVVGKVDQVIHRGVAHLVRARARARVWSIRLSIAASLTRLG